MLSTTKYNVYIPQALLKESQKNLLILSDIVITGDSLQAIVQFLTRKGFSENKIKTASIVCTKAAFDGEKAPDFFWFKTIYTDFYFPWGRVR